ncbi:S-layer homology domain-containing protein [Paenibacillus qinlingensis]|uniref:SLH domain-containing protein n=1 Tax=Paenibacillus qinlingensis TaxID=1837343 RepID=A0ABU1NNA3_9BACL|nr:S-layer homology domain-containing protein [Paenibacillus qinlingensis]MDR6548948.1 hypothetical protein [Paenibacillus qinlingensis]
MKKSLVALSSVLAFSLLGAFPILADQTNQFPDLKNHWAKETVTTAVNHKYVDGYSDGTFRPENYVTGAEFIKMVVTASGLKVEGMTEGSQWFVPYVKAAVEKGLVREESVTNEFLQNPLTRLEMAKVSVRATDPLLQQKHVSINDQGAMYTASSKGLIQGMFGGELAPDGSTTRAQSVTIIERILTLNEGGKLPVDKTAVGQAELQLKRTNIFSMIPAFGGKINTGKEWTPDKLAYASADGKYKGEIDQVIAIDMEDPNDPHRHLLGDIDTLHWFDRTERSGKLMPLVKDYPKSYVILVQSHTVFNNDPESYPGRYGLGMTFSGFESPNMEAFKAGELNSLATLFRDKFGDTAAFILPKEGTVATRGVDIAVSLPAKPPVSIATKVIVSTQRALE